jgi:hypothetical protein
MYLKLSLENAVYVAFLRNKKFVEGAHYKMTDMGHEWPEIERGSDISGVKII